jgi:hypothetical protein
VKSQKICRGLTLQQGKVLRYITSRGIDPTAPKQLINKISWSDLPHTLLEAKKCFNDLVELKLIKQSGKKYIATTSGNNVIAYANKVGLWQKPPPPHITNAARRNK